MLLRLAFQFLRCIKKCSGKFAQTTARNRISSRSKNIFALALKTFGKNPSGGGVGNEGERLRVWDYPNKQNAGAFYGKGTHLLCLLTTQNQGKDGKGKGKQRTAVFSPDGAIRSTKQFITKSAVRSTK